VFWSGLGGDPSCRSSPPPEPQPPHFGPHLSVSKLTLATEGRHGDRVVVEREIWEGAAKTRSELFPEVSRVDGRPCCEITTSGV
jgi:hypothetical protein